MGVERAYEGDVEGIVCDCDCAETVCAEMVCEGKGDDPILA